MVPVLGKSEVRAVRATKPAGHHPAEMELGSRERRGKSCPGSSTFKAALVEVYYTCVCVTSVLGSPRRNRTRFSWNSTL